MSEHHSIIIIGAGLSGLYTAWKLQKQNHDVIVIEARERSGGRILSLGLNNDTVNGADLGPAWIWPQFQPRLAKLLNDLNIKSFKQYTQGDILYEADIKAAERYSDQSAHSESYRISGGAKRLIESLQSELSKNSLHLNTQAHTLNQNPLSIETLRNGKPYLYTANKIVLALPPRITLQTINFKPALTSKVSQYWETIPTWMAGHCKIIFIYDQPFWRNQKLSGEVFSRQGPLTEIYDGTPEDENFYALTAFVGLNAQQRAQLSSEQLIAQCMIQLRRLFGEDAIKVKEVKVKDWSEERYTTTDLDLKTQARHPEYADDLARTLWDGNIILAGTEVAREHGGYLEGALVSADEVVMKLK